jgi:HSP20 family protein
MQPTTSVEVPVDIYESPMEVVIVMPLGGVEKSSIHLSLEQNVLHIRGERMAPHLKETLLPQQGNCFWWPFHKHIPLPEQVYFEKIHSELSPTNILTIIVPKVIIPETIPVHIL